MTGLPDENTLGVVLGRAGRRIGLSGRRATRRGRRPAVEGSFIALGADIVVILRAAYGLGWFVVLWGVYPEPLLAASAWGVLVAVIVTTTIATRLGGTEMPGWGFGLLLGGLALVVALDVAAVWDLHSPGATLTAAGAAGTALLLAVNQRRPAELVTAASVLGGILALVMFVNSPPGTPVDADTLAPMITTVAFAVLPTVIGVVIVQGYRQMVRDELDRALTQSTISAPRYAVGMLASEELARLDLAAERLLDSIATGETKLPLTPKTASVAASLATELRLHLIEGRRETWLYHAVSESELLGRSVTLVDKSALAGLLDPPQRDGLLSATWLLLSDRRSQRGPRRSVEITLGPVQPSTTPRADRKILVPISITSTGIRRNRIDPSIWASLGRVGRYSDSTEGGSLRVDIEALVDNPAEV